MSATTKTTSLPTAAEAFTKFSAFEVFADHVPLTGFRLVVRLSPLPADLEQLLELRANDGVPVLDPDLARATIRAGLALVRTGLVSFVYATAEDVVALIRPGLAERPGASMEVHDALLSTFSARLALVLGREMPARAQLYEFPDLHVVRRAITSLQEHVEETTPLRSSVWLGAQLRGRGQQFHPAMIESLEEQASLLQSNEVDVEALPPWWWRGVAARDIGEGRIEVIDELPGGNEFAALVGEA